MARSISGIYIAQTGAHVVQAAADTGTNARWYLINPLSSGIYLGLRYVEFMSQHGSALATPTSPRLQLTRFTFTGTFSGTLITAAKRASSDATQVAKLGSNSTGITPTLGAEVYGYLPVAALTAVGASAPGAADWVPIDADGMLELAAGEGVCLRQVDAGTTSDTRRYITNIAWQEHTYV